MATGTVRLFAAAKAAAGVDSEPYDAVTLADALADLRRHHGPALARVLDHCSFLVDGAPRTRVDAATVTLSVGGVVEVLPPFAGG